MSTTMYTMKDERSTATRLMSLRGAKPRSNLGAEGTMFPATYTHHRDCFAEFIPSANSGQALSLSKGSQ